MLMFFGKPKDAADTQDENASRMARLHILRQTFHTWKRWAEFAPDNQQFSPVPVQYLLNQMKDGQALPLQRYGANAQIIVLNAHGSDRNLSDKDASGLADMFIQLGVREAGTKEIWLAACNNGYQTQGNDGPEPLSRKLLSEFRLRHQFDVKIYAPRGLLSYEGEHFERLGTEQVLRYREVVILADGAFDPQGRWQGHTYRFNEGWLLAQ